MAETTGTEAPEWHLEVHRAGPNTLIVEKHGGTQRLLATCATPAYAEPVKAALEAHGPYVPGPDEVTRVVDQRPHSRACGIRQHEHGPACSGDCPTCHGTYS